MRLPPASSTAARRSAVRDGDGGGVPRCTPTLTLPSSAPGSRDESPGGRGRRGRLLDHGPRHRAHVIRVGASGDDRRAGRRGHDDRRSRRGHPAVGHRGAGTPGDRHGRTDELRRGDGHRPAELVRDLGPGLHRACPRRDLRDPRRLCPERADAAHHQPAAQHIGRDLERGRGDRADDGTRPDGVHGPLWVQRRRHHPVHRCRCPPNGTWPSSARPRSSSVTT